MHLEKENSRSFKSTLDNSARQGFNGGKRLRRLSRTGLLTGLSTKHKGELIHVDFFGFYK